MATVVDGQLEQKPDGDDGGEDRDGHGKGRPCGSLLDHRSRKEHWGQGLELPEACATTVTGAIETSAVQTDHQVKLDPAQEEQDKNDNENDADDAHQFTLGLMAWMLEGLDDAGSA